MKNYLIIILLFVLLSAGSIFSIVAKPGLFPIHDDTQTLRIIEMSNSLSDGQFPVRWVEGLGYGAGYPIFNFYSPLPYYLGSFIFFVSQNPILSTKIMYIVGILISFIFMYLLSREFTDNYSAILPATLYVYAPYHAVEIYVRGSVGEYFAYGFLPLVLLLLLKSIQTKKVEWVIPAGVSLSLLILSHNIIAMVTYAFIITYLFIEFILYLLKKTTLSQSKPIIFSALIGLLLSSFYLVPAIFESKFTNVSSIITGGSVYKDHFLYLDQLWDSPWGFAGSAIGRNDGISFKIGKIQILAGFLGIISLYILYYKKSIKKELFYFGNILILFLIISIFMTNEGSIFIWNSFSSILAFIQFPWRFLVFIEFFISVLSIFLIILIKNKILRLGIVVLFSILTIAVNIKYFVPQTYNNYDNKYYQSLDYKLWNVSKISDEYLPQNFVKPQDNVLPSYVDANNEVEFEVKQKQSNLISLLVSSNNKEKVIVYNSFFPGWEAYVNNNKVAIENIDGKIAFDIEPGINHVLIVYKGTMLQIIGNMVSFSTIILALFIFIYKKNSKIK